MNLLPFDPNFEIRDTARRTYLAMKLKSKFVTLKAIARPAYFCIVLVVSLIIILKLRAIIRQTKDYIVSGSHLVKNRSVLDIQMAAGLLYHLNSSASGLARAISSAMSGTQLTFASIETKVAPTLFLALSTVPKLNQVSYIGLDGLLFSFYNDDDQTFVVYSNTSFSSQWFTQSVNRDTGMFYGDAVASDSPATVNSSWFQKALNRTDSYSSIGTGWNRQHDKMFLNTVAMDGRGVVSLGFPVQVVIDHFMAFDFNGGYLNLCTEEGKLIVASNPPNIEDISLSAAGASVKFPKRRGHVTWHSFSCVSNDAKYGSGRWETAGNLLFYCDKIDIAGLKSVYLLTYREDRLLHLVVMNSALSIALLALIFVFILASFCTYIYLTARATNREMFLCAALIKQTDATQQAERKSMNKTKAYAGANHDVRSSLAAIKGLIELSQEEAKPGSELAANLSQMENCTEDLVGILNSILDMSKLEAGKMTLDTEDFNLAQLLEEVVDMFYPVAYKKGIDLLLDPCDGTILRSPLVRGDRIKIKQILCNLVSNAIKFTPEGHISVRAVVKRNNLKQEIIASNRTNLLKFLSWFCYANGEGMNDLEALHKVDENPSEMEFEFEVDDTGMGIPKDKQKTIFEDYVQMKESAAGQEGCGLGLGIVQSLVRVMKGELRIVEKEHGERGTCFRFNLFLSTSGVPKSPDGEEHRPSQQHFGFMSPKQEGSSHVVIFLPGEERRRVLKKYIESLNIKVTIIKDIRQFCLELKKIKRKLESLGKSERSLLDFLNKSASTNSDPEGITENPTDTKEGNEQMAPHYRKSSSKNFSSFVLLIVDATIAAASSNPEVQEILTNFRKDILKTNCKLVWLYDQMADHSWEGGVAPEGDFVIYKPLHGSRLAQVLSLLPERRGVPACHFPPKTTIPKPVQEVENPVVLDLTSHFSCSEIEPDAGPAQPATLDSTEKCIEIDIDKPLDGKRVLVAEDSRVLQKLTAAKLQKLGAVVEVCDDGKMALDKVCNALYDNNSEGVSKALPYDCIFMDCEMPVLDGYEATRLIRLEEERYDVRIPIIALTAHAMPEEASKSIKCGMDFHLTKPLQADKLLEVFRLLGFM